MTSCESEDYDESGVEKPFSNYLKQRHKIDAWSIRDCRKYWSKET